MINNNVKTKKPIARQQDFKILIILKLLILFVVLLLPLSFMALDLSSTIVRFASLNKTKTTNGADSNQTQKISTEYNFEAPLPGAQIGDLSNVSKDKIDSLFNNLKK